MNIPVFLSYSKPYKKSQEQFAVQLCREAGFTEIQSGYEEKDGKATEKY